MTKTLELTTGQHVLRGKQLVPVVQAAPAFFAIFGISTPTVG